MKSAPPVLLVALAVLPGFLLTACLSIDKSTATAADLLDVPVPPSFTAATGAPVPSRGSKSPGAAEIAGSRDWVSGFTGANLEKIIAEAVENNRDLRAAASRMAAARAGVQIASSELLPAIGASGDARRFQRVLTSSSRLVGSGDTVSTDRVNSFGLNLNLNWEVDLWGQVRNRVKAARADYVASLGDYYAAELSLAANAARAWFNCIEAESQVRLTAKTLESFESSLDVIEKSWRRGVAPALDLRLMKANVAGARAALSGRERERDTARKSLEVLLGRYPSGELRTAIDLPGLRGQVPAGIPSELLNRRPDLVAAQNRLAASLERLDAARKEFLPSLRLTSGTGLASDDLYQIMDLNRLAWNIAANIAQPVFEGGRIRGEIDLAEARKNTEVNTYAQEVLDAFFEVERALAAEQYLREQTSASAEAAEESIAAEQLALAEYNRGLVDIITVLESQRRSFESQRNLILLKNLLLQNRIDLYLALGGDFIFRN